MKNSMEVFTYEKKFEKSIKRIISGSDVAGDVCNVICGGKF